jgi:hypothetical protein
MKHWQILCKTVGFIFPKGIFVHGWNGTFPVPNPKHDMGGTLTIGMGQNVSVGNPTASVCNNPLQSRTD